MDFDACVQDSGMTNFDYAKKIFAENVMLEVLNSERYVHIMA